VRAAGELWLPVDALAGLGLDVLRSDRGRVVAINSDAEEPSKWLRLLDLPATLTPGRGAFAIGHMAVRAGRGAAAAGQEMVLSITLTAPGYVQVFEVRSETVQPLFGRDGDDLVLYPQATGSGAAEAKVESRLRVPLRAPGPGVCHYILIATSTETDGDPRGALKSGRYAGDWDIYGVRLSVVRP
jgi:hypothetical protein